MLITELDLRVEAGKGGNGRLSFWGKDNVGPDGGNGGNGGSIYVIGVDDIFALANYRNDKIIKADDGARGWDKKRDGQDGEDIILKLPIGTVITIKESGQTINIVDTKNKVKIARGGLGGRGNFELRFRNSTKDNYYEQGKEGTKLDLHIELKLLAEYGLIGLPNAGKSSLLNEFTASRAKVGAYPFTTIEPNIAKLGEKFIADIPGLIEGASEGKGLGFNFLKHVEKIQLLIHCIACDSEDVMADFEIVNKEIKAYKRHLVDKDKIILLTKSDMIEPKNLKEKMKLMKKTGYQVFSISIHDWDGIERLKKMLLAGKFK